MTATDGVDAPTRELFATIDRMDTDGFVDFLSDDATVRFGSAPPVRGKSAIRETIAGFFASLASIDHDIALARRFDGHLFCEGTVTYGRHDGSAVTLPFANVLELADGAGARPRFRHYKVYVDLGPLYAGEA